MIARSLFSHRASRAIVWLAALLLSGCAGLGNGAAPAAGPAPTPASAAAGPGAFDIRVQADDARLRVLVEKHTLLRRYRALTDLDEGEYRRLMVLAERDARELLATEGYFSPEVQVRRDGAATGRPTVEIALAPSTPATVAAVDIAFEGDIATSGEADAARQRASIGEGWGLPDGERFTQERWAQAKTGALRTLLARRYPRGRIAASQAEIDAPAHQARLRLTLDSGPPFRLGGASVTGARQYPPELAERLSWLMPGEVYDQKRLVDAQQRLAASGYYDSAVITVDPGGEPQAAPVSYTVTEAKRHKVQLGVGYSTDGGPRLSLQHRDNRFLGSSWRSDTTLQLDRKTPLAQAEFASLPDAHGWRTALFARHMRQDDGALVTTAQTLRAGRSQNGERFDRNLYLQYDHANVSGAASASAPEALVGDGAAVSANFAWTGRWFDQVALPTRGFGLAAEAGLGLTTIGPRKPFARLAGRWLGFVPVPGGAGRLALRAEAGAIVGAARARLPGNYLFRTGGDTTVRGYGYRSIGIALGGSWVGPGRYMAIASAEWQRPILQQRFPGLLEHTLFIDVGSVANHVSDLRAHWGVGSGLRLITPVGPMALDLAYGLQSHQLRLHMSVGFSF